jgi:hypothetical protein
MKPIIYGATNTAKVSTADLMVGIKAVMHVVNGGLLSADHQPRLGKQGTIPCYQW